MPKKRSPIAPPADSRDILLRLAATTTAESKYVEFKQSFDPSSLRDWCEIIKDIVAITNSGGGLILIGLTDDAKPSDNDISGVLALDPAQVTDKIEKYTGKQFPEFEVVKVSRGATSVAALIVAGSPIPLVFVKPGTYPTEDGKQRTAFAQGTVYFRHGAKSEPGTTDDLRRVLEREISNVRKSWLKGIKKVVKAPAGHVVYTAESSPVAVIENKTLPVRITADENASTFRPESGDDYWPYRQKDLLKSVNDQLKPRLIITGHDILCVRKVFEIEKKRSDFVYRPFKHFSPQYNELFAGWLVENYEKDNLFFAKAREEYKKMKTG